MNYALNKCYGGFTLTKAADDILGDTYDYEEDVALITTETLELRSRDKLIETLEQLGDKAYNTFYSSIVIVEVPDEATDKMYMNYDGMESIIYCLDGKLYQV